MRHKFSIDLGRLKLGPSRPEDRSFQDQLNSSLDSRPPTPKSVRPPLPGDVHAALRAACTYIVTHPKPSHEIWDDGAKPALDYASIRGNAELGAPAERPSNRSKAGPPRQDNPADSSKYAYRPSIPAEESFKHDKAQQQVIARSRVDQLMSSDLRPIAVPAQARPHPQNYYNLQQLAPANARNEAAERARISNRSNSVGTTGSTVHTDSTDYPLSASTPLTSAAITPARSSKRTSTQNFALGFENGSIPKIDPVNGQWMRLELEKHRKAIEERGRGRAQDKEQTQDSSRAAATISTKQVTVWPVTANSSVPARKPVPSRPESRQAGDTSRPETRDATQELKHSQAETPRRGRPDGQQAVDVAVDCRGRVPSLSNSRFGRISRAASRAASRVADKARGRSGSITNDVLGHYIRPMSVQAPPSPTRSAYPLETQHSASRPRSISQHVKEYFRPSGSGTTAGSRKTSTEIGRYHTRAGSTDSLQSGTSQRLSRWKSWRSLNRDQDSNETEDVGRPGSAISARTTRSQAKEQRDKLPVDLNRDLPPLPSLDQWRDIQAEDSLAPTRDTQRLSGTAQLTTQHRSKSSRTSRSFNSASPSQLGRATENSAQLHHPRPATTVPPVGYAQITRSSTAEMMHGQPRRNSALISKYSAGGPTYDARFPNQPEILTQEVRKDKGKRKWWQSKSQQPPEQMAQPGARSSTLIVDEAAGSPVVRF